MLESHLRNEVIAYCLLELPAPTSFNSQPQAYLLVLRKTGITTITLLGSEAFRTRTRTQRQRYSYSTSVFRFGNGRVRIVTVETPVH